MSLSKMIMDETVSEAQHGSYRSLARMISLVENKSGGYKDLLRNLPEADGVVVGITGPPGAGKSTITDGLIGQIIAAGKKAGVICIDPSSPFSYGALLGDRIRMNKWYNHPEVYIRSLANRGSLGGLHPSIVEITDVMKSYGFDYVIIETVGVGQSEVEIAGLADTTVVVLVPEAGDEIQTMKAGLMEIADIFVVNKADRDGADTFEKNLKMMQRPAYETDQAPVIKTNALTGEGIGLLFEQINNHQITRNSTEKHARLLTEKAFHLIVAAKMSRIQKQEIFKKIKATLDDRQPFNLYRFVEKFIEK